MEALLSQEEQLPQQWIQASFTNSPFDKLKIYRQNRLGRITKVLNSTYPVCATLVGENYFKQLCYHYGKRYQDNDPDITFYGRNFAEFLSDYPAILPYLPDVAKLEWACFVVRMHGAINLLNADKLKKIPQEKYAKLRFSLGHTHTLLTSDYPILTIWQAHQDCGQNIPEINLNLGGGHFLVFRREWELMIEKLNDKEFLLLSCFNQGMTFEQTWQTCDDAFSEISITALFAKAVAHGWINEFCY